MVNPGRFGLPICRAIFRDFLYTINRMICILQMNELCVPLIIYTLASVTHQTYRSIVAGENTYSTRVLLLTYFCLF